MALINEIEFRNGLNDIGNAIREKTGGTELIPFKEMADAILSISGGSYAIIPPTSGYTQLLGKSVGLVLGKKYTVKIVIKEENGTTQIKTETVEALPASKENLGTVEGGVMLDRLTDDDYGYLICDYCGLSNTGVPIYDENNCIYYTGNKVASIIIFDVSETSIYDTRLKDFVEGNLTEIVDDTITTVADYGFYYNTIQKVDLPNCESVGERGFSGCKSLVNVNLPNCKTIENCGFYDCKGLTGVNLSNCESAGGSGFMNCSSLTEIELPKAIILGEACFNSCTKLQKVTLNSVTTLGNKCFYYCSALTTLIIRSNQVATLGSTNPFYQTPIQKKTGYIYVPDDLVEDYKVATTWSTYADQIKGLSELEGGES